MSAWRGEAGQIARAEGARRQPPTEAGRVELRQAMARTDTRLADEQSASTTDVTSSSTARKAAPGALQVGAGEEKESACQTVASRP